jgi:hypothetical protein
MSKVDVTKNKAIYFVLPMLQLNKSSFGADNFITCMLDKSGYIVVNTAKAVRVDNELYNSPNYVTDYETGNGSINYVFTVPDEYKTDIKLFTEGKYSQLSAKLKIEIGKIPNISQRVLSMLNPQEKDRQELADILGVKPDMIGELSSVPGESNFIKIK